MMRTQNKIPVYFLQDFPSLSLGTGLGSTWAGQADQGRRGQATHADRESLHYLEDPGFWDKVEQGHNEFDIESL